MLHPLKCVFEVWLTRTVKPAVQGHSQCTLLMCTTVGPFEGNDLHFTTAELLTNHQLLVTPQLHVSRQISRHESLSDFMMQHHRSSTKTTRFTAMEAECAPIL